MSQEKKVITRFAPSPTGFLHIGGVRTALFAYLYAKKMEGIFILRIEDTDKAREVDGSIEHIMESLRWLGIEWDYGPDKPGLHGSCLQSDRLHHYKEYAEMLVAKGLAYPDPYTNEEVNAFREQAHSEKKPFLFRHHRPESFEKWDGTKPLRFKVPEIKRYHWTDEVRGDLEAGEEMLDDFVIIKADGYPTYNFAHIVDDHLMGVTHIMRGEEFISSTPKFLSIYDALGITYPKFVTMPSIMAADGKKKLGKRDGAKDILEYQTEGYLPETLYNFLALIGWNPGTEQEIFSKDELLDVFTLDKIQKSGGAFNEEKLLWMNKEYLHALSDESFTDYVVSALPVSITSLPEYSGDRLQRLLPTIRERIHSKSEIIQAAEEGEYTWAFSAPDLERDKILWKGETSIDKTRKNLDYVHSMLSSVDSEMWSSDIIKESIWEYAEKEGRGNVLWPMRMALTGRDKSPDPFTVASIVGKTETLKRLSAASLVLKND